MLRSTLRIILWFASAATLVGFVYVAVQAFAHPAPLDPAEHALLAHAERFAAGGPIFVDEPGVQPTPLLPGFPVVLSRFVGDPGPHAGALRGLSLACMLIAALLVGMLLLLETRSATLAVAGAGLTLLGGALLAGPAAYAHAEPLALVFVLGAALAQRRAGEIIGAQLAALLLAVACFTHVLAVPFVVAGFLHAGARSHRTLFAFTLGTAAFLGGGYLWLSETLGPSFHAHASDALVRSFRFDAARLLRLYGGELLGTLGVLTLTIVLSFGLPVRPWRGAVGIWTWLAIGGVGAATLASQSAALEGSALVPAVAVFALAGPVALQRVTRHLSAWPGSDRWAGEGMVLAALALQFLQLLAAVRGAA